MVVRTFLIFLGFMSGIPVHSAPIEAEQGQPHKLNIVYLYSEQYPFSTQFRAGLKKEVQLSLRNALGPLAQVDSRELAELEASKAPYLKTIREQGLTSLTNTIPLSEGKWHFVHVDSVDGKLVARTRQHDLELGFVSSLVRISEGIDRSTLARQLALAIAADFGVVGTLDTPAHNSVSVMLKSSSLGKIDQWIKAGDVFAVQQIREVRRAGKAKGEKPTVERTGTRLEGVLLQAVEAPRDGRVVCRIWNRFRGNLPRDTSTLGYRCIKLGTGEGPLQLQLTDPTGNPLKIDTLRVRAAAQDYPENPREKDELTLREGNFLSAAPFRHLALVVVQSGSNPIARFPVEIYPGQPAIRSVKYDPNQPTSLLDDIVDDMLDRIRSARVVQEKAREDLMALQRGDKAKALSFGETALKAMNDESLALRTDLAKLRDRLGKSPSAKRLDLGEGDLKTYIAKNSELRTHLDKLTEVIKLENDPKTMARRKEVEGLLLEANLLKQQADYDAAIAKFEEAQRKTEGDEAAKNELQKAIDGMKKEWTVRDDAHKAARKFIYEVWTKLEKPADVKSQMDTARKSFEKCRSVGDRISITRMAITSPQVFERYADALKKMIDEATEDEDRKALEAYTKVSEALEKLADDVRNALK